MKKQLVAREQEITAVQARMQASYREHVKEVQQLQGKVGRGSGARLGARGHAQLPTGWGNCFWNLLWFWRAGPFHLARCCQPAHHSCVNVSNQQDVN